MDDEQGFCSGDHIRVEGRLFSRKPRRSKYSTAVLIGTEEQRFAELLVRRLLRYAGLTGLSIHLNSRIPHAPRAKLFRRIHEQTAHSSGS